MTKKQLKENIKYLEDNDIEYNDVVREDEPFSGELECYTNAGEDMIITLEEVSKKCLREYVESFDINGNVLMWWPNGIKGSGVPFDNIKEHYEDYEEYLDWLMEICENMPY